ncbi:putative glycoside hydrolase family 45 protein [Botrytis fragariae]|uniref:Putative glycoside hydrolase family 45 protein n=1 Tax=Botrytis fragariae TaxID=1964551 RepID=A0A8H6EGL6_9HELO|nr:putative glycoside hydrolase family 45 protein [Botrytis fragariae]KAF5871619.1 putative glycoside hydrolase family 45 protein [Botrytis fragariae]
MLYRFSFLALTAQVALAAINVNVGTTYQTMDGFGFSQAFGRANDLYNLPSTQRSHALDLLFSPTAGAGFTILRNRIGSGGSGDSIEPASPGSPSGTPKYVWDGSDSHQVWVSQQAKSYGVTRFYANAWSAPGFMKTNGVETHGGYLCGMSGESCSSGNWMQAYAEFLIQYIKYYASVGIDYKYLGFLNEPDYTTAYSSMLASGTQAASFIKVLHPALAAAGLSEVGINCCDMVGWEDQVTATAQLVAAGVEDMIARITSHGYSSDPTSPIKTSRPTWMTEKETTDAWNANWYSTGSSSDGYTWANNIHTAIVNGNVSAYFYWEGIESTTNNAGLIQISGTTVNPSARLWAYAHFSRSVRPGAVRVATSGVPAGINTSAFKNTDGTVSVQMINTNSASTAVQVTTTGFSASSVVAYVTSQSQNSMASLSATVSGGVVSATVPAHGMVTFILSEKGASGTDKVEATTLLKVPTSTTSPLVESKTATSAETTQSHYGKCGGIGWAGPTICAAPYSCKITNNYYSQCL